MVPFQNRAWLRSAPPFFWASPTAQQLLAVVQRTARRVLLSRLAVPPGSGVETSAQALPFQCSASFRTVPTSPLNLP